MVLDSFLGHRSMIALSFWKIDFNTVPRCGCKGNNKGSRGAKWRKWQSFFGLSCHNYMDMLYPFLHINTSKFKYMGLHADARTCPPPPPTHTRVGVCALCACIHTFRYSHAGLVRPVTYGARRTILKDEKNLSDRRNLPARRHLPAKNGGNIVESMTWVLFLWRFP